ncbi:MAG TPA: hypothetical protein DD670_11065 [Planctomycetaceae bacterium]|nr:hypothetical protein [Planctomycetaceae bacterium]
MALWMSPWGNTVRITTSCRLKTDTATSRLSRGRSRLSRIEHLEERTLLSINGAGIERDWLGESANSFLPPSARAAGEPAYEAGAGVVEVDEHVEDSLLDDIDSYLPMPTPNYSETTSPSGLGQAISYDVGTGQETLHAAVMGPFSESGQTLGGLEGVAALLAEMDSAGADDENIALSFNSLSLVDNPDLFPWRVTVKLFMNFSGSNYVASGVLIDPMHVLTAGHCVYDTDLGWATSITVVPAYENGAKPYGEAKSAQLHSWTGWTGSASYNHDIGIIDLDRPIGALTSWYGYGYNTSWTFFTGNTFHNPGYPAESPYDGKYMYYQYGDFDYYIPFSEQVGIWRPAYGGQSGSGAYYMSGDSRTVYAVLSNGSSSATNFVRLTDDKFYDIRDDFLANDTPSTFDLIPLNVKVSPGTINSGAAPSSMSYVVHNYSSVAWSGTFNVDVYLSTNNSITTSDTLLESHSFTRSFSAKGTNTIPVGTPPTIPAATASGNYWIGVIITTTDHSTSNNTTNGWDAAAITVSHVNQAPVISPLPDLSLNEDASLVSAIDLWAYVSDPETSDSGLTYSIAVNTNPNCGVTINSQRYVNVNPVANWNGYSDVTIRVTDPGGLYAQDTFRVTVNSVNDAPAIAGVPDVSLNEDASLVESIDLWAYSSDVETSQGSLTYTIVANTNTNSGVTINLQRYVTVNPAANWHGYSDVTIRVTDPSGLYTQDTFRVTVNPVNDAPTIAGLPDVSLNEDASLPQAIDLWAYSSDVETLYANLTYTIVANTNPNCGVTINSQRYVSVSPAANWNGFSDVTVRVTDPEGLYAQDMFRVTVNPVNDPPVALSDQYEGDEDATISRVAYQGLLINDGDVDGDTIQAVLLSGPTSGTFLSFGATGWFTYKPNSNFHGTDSFTYRAFDGQAYSQPATVTLVIAPVNDAPVAVDDYYACDMGATLTKAAYEGARVNDSDVDGDAIDAVLLSGPANGSLLSFGTTGWFSYRPNADFHGTDSFTYRAFDGQAYSAAATVWIQVLPRIPGDADRNGIVDEADSLIVALNWGETSGMTWNHGDFNADGRIDAIDAAILAANWGYTSAQEAATPIVPAASEVLAGPLQADRSDLARQLVQPPVREAVLADDSSLGRIVSDVDDDVVDLLAVRDSADDSFADDSTADDSVVEPSLVREAVNDAALSEYFNSIEVELSDLNRRQPA